MTVQAVDEGVASGVQSRRRRRGAVRAGIGSLVLIGSLGTAAVPTSAGAAVGAPTVVTTLPCGTWGTAPGAYSFTCLASDGATTATVPDGVHVLSVDVAGASGGDSRHGQADSAVVVPGGLGVEIRTAIMVGAGEQLQFIAGGAGANGFDSCLDASAGCSAAGGANGGGSGGAQSRNQSNVNALAGGGGGESDIRVAPFTQADRMVVAAGGGGASNFGAGGTYNQAGQSESGGGGKPGGGGTGAGGAAGANGKPGSDGVWAHGGAGAPANGVAVSGGGGGGGGYGGGGAGGSGLCCSDVNSGGGAGAGGSNFVRSGLIPPGVGGSTAFAPKGNGSITVGYVIPYATTTLVSVLPANSAVQGSMVTITAAVGSDAPNRPAGSITFYSNGMPIGNGWVSNGEARLRTALPLGQQNLSARYLGYYSNPDVDWDTSRGPDVPFVVTPLAPTPAAN